VKLAKNEMADTRIYETTTEYCRIPLLLVAKSDQKTSSFLWVGKIFISELNSLGW
jgi:hypothetical protein